VSPFNKAFEEWLSLKTCRPVTRQAYETDYRGIYLPHFTDQLLNVIDVAEVEHFLKKLREQRSASARTQQKHLTVLRSFFRWAMRRKFCTENPCEGIRVAKDTRREPMALTLDQARRLLQACAAPVVSVCRDMRRGEWEQRRRPPEYLEVFCLLGLHTGLRKRNLVELRWGQIDLGERRLRVEGEEMKGHRALDMPLHWELVETFQALLRGRKESPRELATVPVLGQKVERVDKSFKTAVRRADLPPEFRVHDMRHSFASWVASRTSFTVLQALMAHSPGNVTTHYTHATWQEKLDAIDRLPRLLTEQKRGAEQAQA